MINYNDKISIGEDIMKLQIALLSGIMALLPSFVCAQANEGVQSFGQAEGSWRRAEEEKVEPMPEFVNDLGKIGIDNIVNAEQVFCYEIFPQNENYEGYAINGFPIRGFCGVLGNQVKDMIVEFFLAQGAGVDFETTERCVVQPKVMLRFVRGVDNTDMLISSPCHSFALFYGGGIGVYNFRPGAEVIDTLLTALSDKHQDFVSPALLNQLLPVGVVQNDEQRKIINKKSEPVRAWEKKVQEDEAKQEEERKKNQSGWNKLKIQFGQ